MYRELTLPIFPLNFSIATDAKSLTDNYTPKDIDTNSFRNHNRGAQRI